MSDLIWNIDFSIAEWIDLHRISWLDIFLSYWRNSLIWLPLYILGILFIWNNFTSAYKLILVIAFTVGLSDYVSSKIIKPQVKRPRPCHYTADQTHFDSVIVCGSGYSFPSSHASNHMALAQICFLIFNRKNLLKWLFVWAFSIGLSQVYVGVHFFSDVMAGFLLGFILASLVYFPAKYFLKSS